MDIVTEAGFYGGKFLKAGQFHEAEVEKIATGDNSAGGGSPDLDSMKRDELVALAKERGVSHEANATKAQIVEAIRAAEAG